MKEVTSTALAKVERHLSTFAEDPVWQRLWLNLESLSWRSLAIIPAGKGTCIDLVHALAAVAWHQRSTRVIVADLRTLNLPALTAARNEIRRRVDGGERVLICMNSLDQNPTSATIAREADKVVICTYLGVTVRSEVKRLMVEVGAQRCLGSIVVNMDGT